MKYAMLGIFALALSSAAAEAADSAWLLCRDTQLVLNVYEHRAGAGDRATMLTLIHGPRFLHGELRNTDAGAVTLGSGNSEFDGEVAIDYVKRTAKLDGTLDFGGVEFVVDSELACEQIETDLD